MKVADLIEKTRSHGGSVEISEGKLILDMPLDFPDDLLKSLRQHKPEIIQHIWQQEASPPSRYQRMFPEGTPRHVELKELVHQVVDSGVVLLWSHLLQDLIAFVGDEYDPTSVPAGFTIYTESELATLFRDDAPVTGLKLIHQAKRIGGKVIGNEPDPET